jgi:hypothetical protein
MWKKMSVAIVLGLALSPSASLAVDAPFNPFEGIVEGIAQSMISESSLAIESNYDGAATGNGNRMAGNVIIGSSVAEQKQAAAINSDVTLTINGGQETSQGINLIDQDGEVAVLMMQGAAIAGPVNMTSSNSEGGNQGINVVIGGGGVL